MKWLFLTCSHFINIGLKIICWIPWWIHKCIKKIIQAVLDFLTTVFKALYTVIYSKYRSWKWLRLLKMNYSKVSLLFIYLFWPCPVGLWNFLGQETNLCHNSNQSHSSDNAGSLISRPPGNSHCGFDGHFPRACSLFFVFFLSFLKEGRTRGKSKFPG